MLLMAQLKEMGDSKSNQPAFIFSSYVFSLLDQLINFIFSF